VSDPQIKAALLAYLDIQAEGRLPELRERVSWLHRDYNEAQRQETNDQLLLDDAAHEVARLARIPKHVCQQAADELKSRPAAVLALIETFASEVANDVT
jgi:hypothetical protein